MEKLIAVELTQDQWAQIVVLLNERAAHLQQETYEMTADLILMQVAEALRFEREGDRGSE